ETPSIGFDALWIVSADAPDDLIYAITKALWNEATQRLLDARDPLGKQVRLEGALDGLSIPLHPGAKRFYREAGLPVDQTGALRYIEGNRDHPVNRGVICGKGASGIMQQASPAKLQKPLKRVGERGSGEFREIEWDEAIATAVQWLSSIRAADPKKLAFFTGRDQSQSLTG